MTEILVDALSSKDLIKKQKSFLDSNFDEIEKEQDPDCKMISIRDELDLMFAEASMRFFRQDNNVGKRLSKENFEFALPDSKLVQALELPLFSWVDTGVLPVRSRDSLEHKRYFSSSERTFLRVDQCYGWAVEKQKKPYFRLTMTDCSCLVGVTDSHIFVFHIGYSEHVQLEAAIKYFEQQGVALEKVFGVVNLNDGNAGGPRATKFEDYLQYGIIEKNMLSFSYTVEGKKTADGSALRILKDMVDLVITPSALLVSRFDLQQTNGPYGILENRIGGYKDEEILQF